MRMGVGFIVNLVMGFGGNANITPMVEKFIMKIVMDTGQKGNMIPEVM